ncbi:unnamed protein product [Caenorhabditis angaria]|uniref:Uncharacterized protein n=1 Tax=Caenorhabditis angaria TaxID=860376 RepID=A0A9P1I893_9PELO|nr:unnamed protein product [Caenorhabditis angaria]
MTSEQFLTVPGLAVKQPPKQEKRDSDASETSTTSIEHENNLTVRTLKSIKGWASSSRNLANQIILEVPASSLMKIKNLEGVGSVERETKHFTGTTTMHGPKRIFNGKGYARAFWIIIVAAALAMLIFQIVVLLQMYLSKPTLSQVSFIVSEGGMDFPAVTVCNFNPIKKSYIRELNVSGDLSFETLEYFLQTNMDTMFIYSNLNRTKLKTSHEEAQAYKRNHSDFRIVKFLQTAGYDCSEMFATCYFGGRRFDCCKYMEPKVTSYGKCYQLDLKNLAPEWMHKQISPGSEAGLQIIADARLEEEMNLDTDDADAIYFDIYEQGFRYFVHEPNQKAELASEGISVSPTRVVYSAIKKTTHNLLSRDNWGNCTETWPSGYSTYLGYSATACRSLCLAQYFLDKCGCSPFTYNIDGEKNICSPYDTVVCMDDYMVRSVNGTEFLELPDCTECHMECGSTSYTAFNSYGDGFNKGSLEWLRNLENQTTKHINGSVSIINIFFLEMFYTSYSQVQATSLTEILSDIGGNMGMFLGMSVITITELSLFFSKIFWIVVSKSRRDYMYNKKRREKTQEQHLEEAVKEYQEKKSRRNSRDDMNRVYPTMATPAMAASASTSSMESMIELKLDVEELRNKLSQPGVTRLRLPSDKKSSPPPVFTIDGKT